MAIKKSALYSSLWKSCDELRGGMDASQYKDYVLTLLFVKYVSDKYAGKADSLIEIPEGGGFADLRALKGDKEIGDKINKAIGKLAEANRLKSVIDVADFNDEDKLGKGKEMQDRLSKLVSIFNDLDFRSNRAEGDDLLGDAYEYLMRHFATESGKSKGQFYTPAEVSRIMAKVIGIGKETRQDETVYDPACGSGSLLLKFAKVLGKDNIRTGFFGQEINITTYNLCRINMFLHDINYEQFDIAHGNTLTDPHHQDDELFEAIVSNPPYSIKWDGDANSILINDDRFTPAGVLAPKSKADLAFVMHALSLLATNGTAAIVSFPGVMYRSGAEQKIRKYLVDKNYVDAVIQLPADLFFGTTIATCILVLKKNKSDSKVLFIDATNECIRSEAKNKLAEKHIKKILEWYKDRNTKDHFSRLVEHKEIEEKDYNISVGSYVEAKDTREVVNITELNAGIEKIVARQSDLRTQIDAIVADLEGDAM